MVPFVPIGVPEERSSGEDSKDLCSRTSQNSIHSEGLFLATAAERGRGRVKVHL